MSVVNTCEHDLGIRLVGHNRWSRVGVWDGGADSGKKEAENRYKLEFINPPKTLIRSTFLILSRILQLFCFELFTHCNMATLAKTLAIVKPDAVDQTDEIVDRAKRAGFAVLNVQSHISHTHPSTSRAHNHILHRNKSDCVCFSHGNKPPSVSPTRTHSTKPAAGDIQSVPTAVSTVWGLSYRARVGVSPPACIFS